jgi:hypothetical protein
MTLKETAYLLAITPEQVKSLIEIGCKLAVSETTVRLEATMVGEDFAVSDEQLDKFIGAFAAEEPARHPPVAVRRELLVETRHRCGICRDPVTRLQFHHLLEWEKVKHHDPKHMLAVCGTCHDDCSIGKIDKRTQEMYKAKLQTPHYEAVGPDEVKIKRDRDLAQLEALFSQITRYIVDGFFEEASSGYMLYSFSTHYWEGFMRVFGNRNFHLYDTHADKLIRDFVYPVQAMMQDSCEWMDLINSGTKLNFRENIRNLTCPGFHEAVARWFKLCEQADAAYRRLYTYLRENYLELDFEETDAAARADYRHYHLED